jgi:hypothetical protein
LVNSRRAKDWLIGPASPIVIHGHTAAQNGNCERRFRCWSRPQRPKLGGDNMRGAICRGRHRRQDSVGVMRPLINNDSTVDDNEHPPRVGFWLRRQAVQGNVERRRLPHPRWKVEQVRPAIF